jgi:chromosome segregation ATPase
MNTHFKAALEMYGQLTAYTKQGYELREEKSTYKPFLDACNADVSELILLQTYLGYKYGNNLDAQLKQAYDEEEALEHERKKQEMAAKLLAAKQQLEEKKISAEEYILLQEEQIKLLEKDAQELKRAEVKIGRLNEKISAQETDIQVLQENAVRLNEELMEKGEQIRAKEREFAAKTKELQAENDSKLKENEATCKARIEEAKKAATTALAEREKIDEERRLIQAQLHGLRQMYNLNPANEDYTSKEHFLELEKEFNAFEDFLKMQWKYTKKRIRKDILWTKPTKQDDSNDRKE